MSHQKTNAIRIIESLGIPYKVAVYDPGDEHADAETVAAKIGAEPEIVFKTLVSRDEAGNVIVFCLPANCELDLKKAARASGVKSVALIKLAELTPLTGYVRGGCSPVGMKKKYRVIIDESAQMHDAIYVNAGSRGMQMLLSPYDLATACDGKVADIVQ